MTTLQEAAQQALEALEKITAHPKNFWDLEEEITALRAALAQQEQEPVAWQVHPFDYGIGSEGVYAMTQRPDQVKAWERKGWTVQPLYTTPPRREWRGLTDEEIRMAYGNDLKYRDGDYERFARAIEQACKEKNHD